MTIKQLDHINFSVANLEDSIGWYRRIFGFEPVERGFYGDTPYAILKSGEAMLCMYEHGERASAASGNGAQHHISHIGFRIVDRDSWEAQVATTDVHVHHGPIDYPHSKAWYVRDPSGHEIEVVAWNDDSIAFPRA